MVPWLMSMVTSMIYYINYSVVGKSVDYFIESFCIIRVYCSKFDQQKALIMLSEVIVPYICIWSMNEQQVFYETYNRVSYCCCYVYFKIITATIRMIVIYLVNFVRPYQTKQN